MLYNFQYRVQDIVYIYFLSRLNLKKIKKIYNILEQNWLERNIKLLFKVAGEMEEYLEAG